MRRILIIQGHPDASQPHYGHALAQAYAEAAQQSGHEVRSLEVATLNFPLLRRREEWDGPAVADIVSAQKQALWADHWVIIYPLWMGDMPALLKAFFEQLLRPGFALNYENGWPHPMLKGKSAHVIVTMGMPGLAYRWFYGAHTLKSLKRSILHLCGVRPVKTTVIGMVEKSSAHRQHWLAKIRRAATYL